MKAWKKFPVFIKERALKSAYSLDLRALLTSFIKFGIYLSNAFIFQ